MLISVPLTVAPLTVVPLQRRVAHVLRVKGEWPAWFQFGRPSMTVHMAALCTDIECIE